MSDYECSELGFNSGMLTIARSLNNPSYDHDLLKLQLHDAIYRLRFYSNSLIHILLLSNSHNNVASIQKNRDDKSHRVIVALIIISNIQHQDSLHISGNSKACNEM